MSEKEEVQTDVLQAAGHGGLARSAIFPGALEKVTDLAEVLMYLLVSSDDLFSKESTTPDAPSSSQGIPIEPRRDDLKSFIPRPYFASWTVAQEPRASSSSAAAELTEYTVNFADMDAVKRTIGLLLQLVDCRVQLGLENMTLAEEYCRMHMSNELHGMQAPCVMDVKLGKRRHTPRTPIQKVAKMEQKEGGKFVAAAGVRICGWVKSRLQQEAQGQHSSVPAQNAQFAVCERLDREHFRDLDAEGFVAALRSFCDCDPLVIRDVEKELKRFWDSLSSVSEALLQKYGFVSSSLLIMYDSSARGSSAKVRWIDFARSGPRRFHFHEDSIGMLSGVESLMKLLQLARESST